MLTELVPEFVKTMPYKLEQGKLYVSMEFEIAIHLCACGCGIETVTPFDKPNGWQFTNDEGRITLHPSIGNQQFPCKSHYWIKNNKVEQA